MDRTNLGDMLAQRLKHLHGQDAVILCLQENSLLTCLTMATELHAWVFPLVYSPIYTTDQAHRLIGAFDQAGTFCALEPKQSGEEEKTAETDPVAELAAEQRSDAMKSIHEQVKSYKISLDKHLLDGRDLVLAADVLTSPLPLIVAQQFLKDIFPRSLTAVVGNATPDVAQLLRISAGKTEILDVLSGIAFDHDHYFEHPDSYTEEQKRTLTEHIAAYWR